MNWAYANKQIVPVHKYWKPVHTIIFSSGSINWSYMNMIQTYKYATK
jgi:hypothetical protein